MNHSNLYGPDFGLDSSNSSSTLTLKFDECEAITESSPLDVYQAAAADASNASSLMDSLKDNPVLTTASMPIPTRNMNVSSSGNQNLYRMPLDMVLDFDLSQDLNMPQLLLMDGADLNDDGSPTMLSLGQSGYGNNSSSLGGGGGSNSTSPFSPLAEGSRPIDVTGAQRSGDYLGQATGHNDMQLLQSQQNQHLLATTAAGQQMWGSEPLSTTTTFVHTKSEPLNLDDDAIFQVDKADLIQGEFSFY